MYVCDGFRRGWSLPSRERGLKFQLGMRRLPPALVAPFAGAWIEMLENKGHEALLNVAPFAGAWIEIGLFLLQYFYLVRRSLRGSVD